MTTRDEISIWFDEGVQEGARYMVVWCDSYSHEDYPKNYADRDAVEENLRSRGEMQRPMECYDLRADKAEQIAMPYCWAL